jgi:hypothetical protein
MTLNDLLERYEAELAPLKDEHTSIPAYAFVPDYNAAHFDARAAEDKPIHPAIRAMVIAAKLYCVARDEGMDAALMWKLANA